MLALADAVAEFQPGLEAGDQSGLAAWLELRRALVRAVGAGLAAALDSPAPVVVRKLADYVSCYVPFQAADGSQLTLWVFATVPGGVCSLPGTPASLAIELRMSSQQELSGERAMQAMAGGFDSVRDTYGYRGYRRYFELDQLEQSDLSSEQAARPISWTLDALRLGGLIGPVSQTWA